MPTVHYIPRKNNNNNMEDKKSSGETVASSSSSSSSSSTQPLPQQQPSSQPSSLQTSAYVATAAYHRQQQQQHQHNVMVAASAAAAMMTMGGQTPPATLMDSTNNNNSNDNCNNNNSNNSSSNTQIISATERDVLNGRGQGVQRHPGNVKYRTLVFVNKSLYAKCPRSDKIKISKGIVAAVRNVGGRFLELDERSGIYHDIGDRKAMEKTSQALREGQTRIRQQIFANEEAEEAAASRSSNNGVRVVPVVPTTTRVGYVLNMGQQEQQQQQQQQQVGTMGSNKQTQQPVCLPITTSCLSSASTTNCERSQEAYTGYSTQVIASLYVADEKNALEDVSMISENKKTLADNTMAPAAAPKVAISVNDTNTATNKSIYGVVARSSSSSSAESSALRTTNIMDKTLEKEEKRVQQKQIVPVVRAILKPMSGVHKLGIVATKVKQRPLPPPPTLSSNPLATKPAATNMPATQQAITTMPPATPVHQQQREGVDGPQEEIQNLQKQIQERLFSIHKLKKTWQQNINTIAASVPPQQQHQQEQQIAAALQHQQQQLHRQQQLAQIIDTSNHIRHHYNMNMAMQQAQGIAGYGATTNAVAMANALHQFSMAKNSASFPGPWYPPPGTLPMMATQQQFTATPAFAAAAAPLQHQSSANETSIVASNWQQQRENFQKLQQAEQQKQQQQIMAPQFPNSQISDSINMARALEQFPGTSTATSSRTQHTNYSAFTNRPMPIHHHPQSVIISEPARVAPPQHDIQQVGVKMRMIDHSSSVRQPYQHNSTTPNSLDDSQRIIRPTDTSLASMISITSLRKMIESVNNQGKIGQDAMPSDRGTYNSMVSEEMLELFQLTAPQLKRVSQLGLKDLDLHVGREVNSLYKDDGNNYNDNSSISAGSPAATTAMIDDRVSELRLTDTSRCSARLTDSSATTTSSLASTGNTSHNNQKHSRPELTYFRNNTPPPDSKRSKYTTIDKHLTSQDIESAELLLRLSIESKRDKS